MTNSILVVEDDPLVRDSIYEVLSLEKYQVAVAVNGKEGFARLGEKHFDVALVDLRLPDAPGIEFLKTAKERFPDLDMIMMTGFGTVETAVEAMKMGARDYLTKPINDDEIKLLLRQIFDTKKLREENESLKDMLFEKRSHFHNLIGEDSKMQKIYSLIQAISDTDTTVLLQGDSGTGKGMIAQAIHYSDPTRKDGPYVEVSCGAIPRELLESELFGHVKGAFTSAIRDRIGRFELADGGTILLDEIDALPPYLQVKLLRVLQQKVFERVGDTKTIHVNVRIIAATNHNLQEAISRGTFREDLYYRLNVITIDVPPLRERKGDIPTLVRHFLNVFNEKTKRHITSVSKQAMKILMDYDWPGNVRELENFLERAVVLTQGEVLDTAVFPDSFTKKAETLDARLGGSDTALKEILKDPEKKIIVRALEQAGWNRKKAAAVLKINRTTLYNKMKQHHLL
ncbi:MAG: sigma-54-dependent Fis family transcriptional regulator [Candidatus Omnitrophica bacterium]|nr:sigma-54-dependent Fis family transcriptional regulator [Candidatus Omnitrophota bacterium]